MFVVIFNNERIKNRLTEIAVYGTCKREGHIRDKFHLR